MNARLLVSAVVLALAASATARADEIDRCASAFESAQRLRQRGELRQARAAAATCARDVCPAVLRKDCTTWSSELANAVPTLRVHARSPGCAPEAVLRVDGNVVGEGLVELDPGSHVVSATLRSGARAEKSVMLAQGEKDRAVDLVFETRDACAPTEPPPDTHPAPEKPSRGVPVLSIALGGVGVVALGVATWSGLRGLSITSDLEARHCEPNCATRDVDHARDAFLAADILGAVGIAALGAAVIVYFVQDDATPRRAGMIRLLPSGVAGAF